MSLPSRGSPPLRRASCRHWRGADCPAPAPGSTVAAGFTYPGDNIMAERNWSLRGEYMESCNCDYLCPCIYTNPQGPATHDHCTVVMGFRIDDGSSGATRLNGLKFAFVIRSGRVMSDGNWVFGVVVDDTADPDQRQALGAIASGDSGGTPSVIRQNLVGDFRGVAFQPIDFVSAGLTRRLAIPGIV